MYRGYRLLIAALVGCLGLAGAAEFQNSQRQDTHSETGNHQRVSPSPIIKPQNNANGTNSTHDQCVGYDGIESPCDRASVQASIEQARDADWQADAAAWGVIIGLIAMGAAIGAARWAKDAALHTKRSADAAFEGQRAWVTLNIEPKRVLRSAAGVDFDVDFLAKNIGQTTATHFCFKTELFFKGPFEDSESIIKNIDATIEEWKLEYTNSASVLIPQDTEINHFWKFIQSNQIVWHNGFSAGKDAAQPIFLAAVFYRTAARPDVVQQSWRSWYLSELDLGGHFTAFVGISFQPVESENLKAKPFRVNLTHKEYPAT